MALTPTDGWKKAFAGELSVNMVVQFDMPYFDRDAGSAAVRSVSGVVTEFVPFHNGNSPAVRFAVDGEVFRTRTDFHVLIWIESIPTK